jgi:D-glucosaminate-6-phosphate ammonia-lyase
MSPSTSTRSSLPVPTFESIGARTLINCQGTYTILTGSRALDTVVAAMAEATNHYVHMDDLMDKVGQRLAELTGAEWGYISSGCAAALTEITAACIAGADPERMSRLPDTTGMKNQVIMQRGHRNAYDRAIRMTGAQIIEVVTEADLRAAINDQTALIAITGDLAHLGQIPVERTIAIAREHGIPCLVDAAAERPLIPNPYLQMGADAVTYSGGKCLRGPQASGLALGRKDLLWAAFLNAAPHHGLGRPMKAGKEEIMGLLAAVEAWVLDRDHEAEWRMWEGYLATIQAAIGSIPTVSTTIEQPGIANVAPTMRITWDTATLRVTPAQIHRELLEGQPAIACHLLSDGLRIMTYMMEDGDDAIVAQRLSALLTAERPPLVAPVVEPPAVEVSGEWVIELRYVLDSSTHALSLTQDGATLRGEYCARYERVPLEGHVQGQAVAFSAVIGYEANKVRYRFTGTAEQDGTMSGEVDLGEYGSAQWSAHRVG